MEIQRKSPFMASFSLSAFRLACRCGYCYHHQVVLFNLWSYLVCRLGSDT